MKSEEEGSHYDTYITVDLGHDKPCNRKERELVKERLKVCNCARENSYSTFKGKEIIKEAI